MVVAQISPAECVYLATNPGYLLRPDAANAWDRAVGAFGKQVLITGALRSYAIQKQIFLERYQHAYIQYAPGKVDGRLWPSSLGGDNRYWYRKPGEAAAAVPGTSNHGGGVAVDVKTSREPGDPTYDTSVVFGSWADVDRTSFLRVAEEHGWADDEGRSVGELWHLTYYPDRDKHKGEKPKPLPKEDEFMAGLTEDEQNELKDDANVAAIKASQAVDKLERIEATADKRRELDLAFMKASSERERALVADVDKLSSAVTALATAQGLTTAQVAELLKDALSGLNLHITTD